MAIVSEGEHPTLLEAYDLHKTYAIGARLPLPGRARGRVSAGAGVNLTLRAGETLGIVGESGCGKSTLARMLVGLESPDQGRVYFRGTDVTKVSGVARRAVRRQVQMVFQDPYQLLNPRMTVLDIVAEPLDVHGISGGRAARREKVPRADRRARAVCRLRFARASLHPCSALGGACAPSRCPCGRREVGPKVGSAGDARIASGFPVTRPVRPTRPRGAGSIPGAGGPTRPARPSSRSSSRKVELTVTRLPAITLVR